MARIIAQRLGIPAYDKEIIKLTAEESGLNEAVLQSTEESDGLRKLISWFLPSGAVSTYDQAILAQAQVIRNIAAQGPCVIVGRCADYVLRERKDLLSVFIHAPLSFRAQRAQKVYEKTASNIEDFVKKKDKKRAAFYNYFSQNKWGDARHYHLAISSVYGVDFAVEVLKHAAESFPGGEAL